MIFNRTLQDVILSKEIRDKKVKNFQELTSEEIETLERGMLTVNTLNRIEERQNSLKSLFNSLGYWNTQITNRAWTNTDFFNIDDFQRIVDNMEILRQAFFEYSDTPKKISTVYRYDNINAIEKILHDLDVMINDVKSRYKRCGTFKCGG